jgi:hypothetical protein
MSKYYCSEMCNTVAYDSIQVLGGSGYMKDYPCERHARDARITTIYEGTSQLQVVAAVRGVCNGTAERIVTELAGKHYDPQLKDMLESLADGAELLKRCVVFVKEKGTEYMDLYGRALVDMAVDLIIGYLFCGQASTNVDMEVAAGAAGGAQEGGRIDAGQRKAMIARWHIKRTGPMIAALSERICSADTSAFGGYDAMVGPVPAG